MSPELAARMRRLQIRLAVILGVLVLGVGAMFWRYQANFHGTLVRACHQRNAAEIWRRNLIREQATSDPDPKVRATWEKYLASAPPLVDCEAL
jgi:hypothetical protein